MPASAITGHTIRRNSTTALLMSACLAIGGCGDRVKGEVVRQLPRPGNGVTAILTKDSGHWVTSHVYFDVYLKADKDGVVDHVFSARDMDTAVKIRWQSPNVLMISMTCGEIGIYKNFSWYRPEPNKVFIGLEGNQPCKPDEPAVSVPRVQNNELVLPK